MYDCVVVGCGLSGAVAARVLAEADLDVLVVERRKHIGGNCRDYYEEHGHLVHAHGPHIFHTTNREVFEYLSRFTAWRYYQHRVQSYVHGRFVPFPITRDTLAELFGLSITASEVREYLADQVRRSTFDSPPRTFRDAVVSQVGQELYRIFYEGYTAKQWRRPPEELDPELARRIPVRSNRDGRYFSDPYQGIPAAGYTRVFENLLDHPRIRLLLGCDWFDCRDELEAQLCVYTGKLDRFFDHRHGELEYSSLRFEWATLQEEQHQPAAVVNYPNDYDWTRITEYKQLTGQRGPTTTICYEYPQAEGHPYYPVMTRQNQERRARYLEEVAVLQEARAHLFLGRLATYAHLNMDQAVRAALDGVATWLETR